MVAINPSFKKWVSPLLSKGHYFGPKLGACLSKRTVYGECPISEQFGLSSVYAKTAFYSCTNLSL